MNPVAIMPAGRQTQPMTQNRPIFQKPGLRQWHDSDCQAPNLRIWGKDAANGAAKRCTCQNFACGKAGTQSRERQFKPLTKNRTWATK
jgi:hypothetical protein